MQGASCKSSSKQMKKKTERTVFSLSFSFFFLDKTSVFLTKLEGVELDSKESVQ